MSEVLPHTTQRIISGSSERLLRPLGGLKDNSLSALVKAIINPLTCASTINELLWNLPDTAVGAHLSQSHAALGWLLQTQVASFCIWFSLVGWWLKCITCFASVI